MKSHLFPVAAVIFAFALFPVCNARAEEKWERPGTKEQAAVDQANKVLDGVYRDLMAKAGDLDAEREKTSLRDAQRAWIKWRDAEAMFIAHHGGAVGGSALRIGVAEAQLKLINERINGRIRPGELLTSGAIWPFAILEPHPCFTPPLRTVPRKSLMASSTWSRYRGQCPSLLCEDTRTALLSLPLGLQLNISLLAATSTIDSPHR